MSVINMLVAARAAFAERRNRYRVYEELAALDDHSLEDIGLHRSQLPGLIERLFESVELDAAPPVVRKSGSRADAGVSAAQQRLHQV
jgi:uncharacterized protein YjiS (DUF1127 family)